MFYCDASLIVPVLTPEVHSAAAERWLRAQPAADLAVSDWVALEVASALAMKVRRGALSDDQRKAALARWASLAGGMLVLPIGPADHRKGALNVDTGPRGLRAGDALHLAIAARQGCGMATLDDDLAAAAASVRLDVAAVRHA